jgi:uncharacterized membrane protein
MSRLFWLITAGFIALATHLLYVLFVPAFIVQRSIANTEMSGTTNSFVILDAVEQARLFPSYPASSVFGACAFDLSKGNVALTADMPQGPWTLTVYSSTGRVIYAVNDIQTGAANFTVSLSRSPSLYQQLTQAANDDVVATTGWDVRSDTDRGIAVFWIPAFDPALRPAIAASVQRSSCATVPATADTGTD